VNYFLFIDSRDAGYPYVGIDTGHWCNTFNEVGLRVAVQRPDEDLRACVSWITPL